MLSRIRVFSRKEYHKLANYSEFLIQ